MPDLTSSLLPPNYEAFLNILKDEISRAQLQAAQNLNQEMIFLYWRIGQEILTRQQKEGWGAKIITRLAKDLRKEFPHMTGLSRTNLSYMRAFAEAYPEERLVKQFFGKIPWGHNVRLLDMVKVPAERLWYAQKAIDNGWSRNVLQLQIESGLYRRQGGAITNFDRALPKPQSDLAQQLLKDPYSFEFLNLSEESQERDLERALIDHIREFLLELGVGFAFVGSQYNIEVDGDDYYLDLLFYHLQLRCYVVIDLKMSSFQPEYSGKMNFYVSAVDNLLRHPDDQPTIGIVLCKGKKKTIVEYALQDLHKPIGVSTFKLSDALPESLQQSLPTVEQLELELEAAISEIEARSTNPSNDDKET